jgi:sialidase-1
MRPSLLLAVIPVIVLTPVLNAADTPVGQRNYTGQGSPVTQGWTESHDKEKAAVASPGARFWRIEDDDNDGPEGLYYRAELSDDERDHARHDGFVYRWRVRIAEETQTPSRAISTEVCVWRKDKSGRLRFGVQLGRRGSELLGKFHSGTHGSVEGSLVVDDVDAFHDWELLFDGATRTVNLRVDGCLLLSTLCDNDDSGHHLVFGSRATDTGVSEWQRVHFTAGLPPDAEVSAPSIPPERIEVYVAGADDYFAYRIPSLLVTPAGTLLAFAEGRKSSLADLGNNDMVLKRSTDGGKTWGPLQIIYDEGESTIGNPTPVVDEDTGRIWLVFGREGKEALEMHSDDDGATWTKPVDITAQVKKPEWGFYGIGPGVGVQLRHGEHKGRLIIPAYHRLTEHKGSSPYANVFYSDDHGKSWQVGGTVGREMCECQIAETANGGLIVNARNHWWRTGKSQEKSGKRIVARSSDGGVTWTEPILDAVLIEPTCQASLLRYSGLGDEDRSRLLFANPAATPTGNWGGPRHRLTVRMSYDEGRTWPVSRLVEPGLAAYSALARLADGRIGILYESGGYKQLTFAAFDLTWLAPE